MLRALVFDFDGLIIDTETSLIDAYGDVHRTHGVAFDRTDFLRSVGHAAYSFDPWHAFSRTADRAQLEAERLQNNADRLERLTPLPGVRELLTAARERQLPIGLASNSEHSWVEGHLRRLGLHDYFHFIACREDVAAPKPEPDLYHLVRTHFDLPPTSLVAFEDSHTGSLAAKRAGLHCVVVPNESTAHHDVRHADWRLASLAEVDLARLETWLATLRA